MRARPAKPRWFGRISLKLSIFTFLLLLAVTASSSFLVLRLMEENMRKALLRRGESVCLSITAPAAFHLLAGDRLALDNLVARIGTGQEDLVYAAVVDGSGKIAAHSRLEEAGGALPEVAGKEVVVGREVAVRRLQRYGKECFEFSAPIVFSGRAVGRFHLGLAADGLEGALASARRRVLGVSLAALALGVVGSVVLSRAFTTPIRRLAEGVSELQEGRFQGEVHVSGRDELGELTRSFNAMALEIARQKNGLAAYARDLEESYLATIRLLAAAMDARDEYTLGHSTRVANLSVLLGRRLGFDETQLKSLAVSCFLHDVGKIRIPDRILNKRGPLSTRERDEILRHPEHGAEILRLAESLHRYIPAVLHHHEWYNGEGYPAGLRAEQIPIEAAIVALADTYDAMTSSRPYRPGLSREEAIREIRRFRGKQFSPGLVDLFVEALQEYTEENLPAVVPGVA